MRIKKTCVPERSPLLMLKILNNRRRIMEFPIVDRLSLPMTRQKMVTEFLRDPHPIAVMVSKLTFGRRESKKEPGMFWLTVGGNGIRHKDPDCGTWWDESWLLKLMGPDLKPAIMVFMYDDVTGEPVRPQWMSWEESDEASDDSDVEFVTTVSDDSDVEFVTTV